MAASTMSACGTSGASSTYNDRRRAVPRRPLRPLGGCGGRHTVNILVIGVGGREHALAWKIAQSPRVAKVFVAPGNAGTALEPPLVNVAVTAIADLVTFAR